MCTNTKEECKQASSVTRHTKKRTKIRTSINDALAGAAAGAFAKTATAPIERVKLLMQLGGSIEARQFVTGGAKGATGNSFMAWNVAKSIYYEEGILAFWRGEIKIY